MKPALLYPVLYYVVYIWGLLLLNLWIRKKAARQGEVSPAFFKTYQARPETVVSDRVVTWGRHIDNQFQAPIVFMITCLAHMQTSYASGLTLALAWSFVGSRMIHSYIHLKSNHVMKRALAYAIGWLFILGLWVDLLVQRG